MERPPDLQRAKRTHFPVSLEAPCVAHSLVRNTMLCPVQVGRMLVRGPDGPHRRASSEVSCPPLRSCRSARHRIRCAAILLKGLSMSSSFILDPYAFKKVTVVRGALPSSLFLPPCASAFPCAEQEQRQLGHQHLNTKYPERGRLHPARALAAGAAAADLAALRPLAEPDPGCQDQAEAALQVCGQHVMKAICSTRQES